MNHEGSASKEYTIVVNARERVVSQPELSFAEVVALAFDDASAGENRVFTVNYRRKHGEKPEGSMVVGDVVKLKEGLIFSVTRTDKS